MQENNCPICRSTNLLGTPTKVSKFLAEYIFKNDRKATKLNWCKNCGFSYYELRLTDNESQRLYTGYRGDNYQRIRQKHDVWYTKKINKLLGSKEGGVLNRNKNLARVLDSTTDVTNIQSILDFGGDRGQCFPDNLSHCTKYIYDISGIEAENGVIPLKTIEDCKTQPYSLIMCNHVLEHVNDPSEVLSQIAELMGEDTLLYIELPFDSPFYSKKTDSLKYLFNKYFSWPTIFKHYINTKKDGCFAPMSEHINYFTSKSVEILLKNQGFTPLFSEIRTIDCDWNKPKILSFLAVK